MNAREAMQFLLEGKTLERDNPWYLMKLDESGTLVSCDSKRLLYTPYAFRYCHTMIGDFDRIYKEKEFRPCPFCGSIDIKEVYYDDEGDMLEEWMMEEANSDGCDYKSWQEYLDVNGYVFMVDCSNCHGSVSSKDSMKDAWAKWNWRAEI